MSGKVSCSECGKTVEAMRIHFVTTSVSTLHGIETARHCSRSCKDVYDTRKALSGRIDE